MTTTKALGGPEIVPSRTHLPDLVPPEDASKAKEPAPPLICQDDSSYAPSTPKPGGVQDKGSLLEGLQPGGKQGGVSAAGAQSAAPLAEAEWLAPLLRDHADLFAFDLGSPTVDNDDSAMPGLDQAELQVCQERAEALAANPKLSKLLEQALDAGSDPLGDLTQLVQRHNPGMCDLKAENLAEAILANLAKSPGVPDPDALPARPYVQLAGSSPIKGLREIESAIHPSSMNKQQFRVFIRKCLSDASGKADLLRKACYSHALRSRLVKDCDPAQRAEIVKAALADKTLSAPHRMLLLTNLVGSSELRKILKGASTDELRGLGVCLSDCSAREARTMLKSLSAAQQLTVVKQILGNKNMSRTERTDALRRLLGSTDARTFRYLLKNAGASERQALAAVMAGTPSLMQRLGRLSSSGNGRSIQQTMSKEILKLPIPWIMRGQALHTMLAAMSGRAKNSLVSHIARNGLMPNLARSQAHMPLNKGVLKGLNPLNAASLREAFRVLAKEAKQDPRVADPTLLGQRVTAQVTTSKGSSKANQKSTSVQISAGVKFPVKAVEVSVSGSVTRTYSSTRTRSNSTSRSSSTSVDKGAMQRYQRAVKQWRTQFAYLKAATHIDNWAAQRGSSYSRRYTPRVKALHQKI